MESLLILDKLKKRINATLQQVGETMIGGGVDNMEKYKYLLPNEKNYLFTNLCNDFDVL